MLLAAVLLACKKDDPENNKPAETGSLNLKFENMAGNQPLQLNDVHYLNHNGDSFTVTNFNYYISNIRLTASDGSVYTEKESYHLLKAADAASLQFTLGTVPVKNYTSITFMIGVDSVRNSSGAQTGALDPAHGLFWSWSSGYIMAQFEGYSPKSQGPDNLVMYHVGGFSGTNNVLKIVTLNFPAPATVTTSIKPAVTVRADLQEWFKPPHTISFSDLYIIHMAGDNAKKIAENYTDMFTVSQVQN